MTKKKSTTKTKPQDTIAETEQTPGQKYETEIQQTLDEWVEASIEDLEARNLALDLPNDGRKFKPKTSELFRSELRNQGARLVKSWQVSPTRPKPPVFSLPPPSKSALERAAQIRRIEESSRSDVNLKDRINEDRERARLPPLP